MKLYFLLNIVRLSVLVLCLPLVSSHFISTQKTPYGIKSLARSTISTAATIRAEASTSRALSVRGGQSDSSEMTNSTETNDGENPSRWVQLRRTVFPIYGEEVKKFFLISSIKFYIILALTLTRDTKDTLVVTQCGAEAIAFLKVCSWFLSISMWHESDHVYFVATTENKRYMEYFQRQQPSLRCIPRCLTC